MKSGVSEFINGLIIQDYILFASSFILFILFIFLAILLRHKLALALLFVLLGFAIFVVGPTLGYTQMHNYLFSNRVTLTTQKKLSFTQAIVVKGVVSNESKRDFKSCRVLASAYRVTSNKYKNYLYRYKPIRKGSTVVESIAKGESRDFKIFIEPFTYQKDYNISLGADCK